MSDSESPKDDRLWCMHISGCDDLYPAPDRATAQAWAANMWSYMQRASPEPHPYDPVTNFTVQEWPYDAKQHADGLESSIAANTPAQESDNELVPVTQADREAAQRLKDELLAGRSNYEIAQAFARRRIEVQAELLEALISANNALAQVTAFEMDARCIMGNTNFEIVKLERGKVRAAIAKARKGDNQ